jgi:hypothetical protein
VVSDGYHAAGATVRRIRRKPEEDSGYRLPSVVELVEVVITRGLVACALVGLAASNATLRQLVDAVL